MTNHTCVEYSTAASLKTAVDQIVQATGAFDIIPYREEGTTKFMLVQPSPSLE